jgi:hypothetical protein
VIYIPFKDREEVKKWIKTCGRLGNISNAFAFLFIIVGVIGEALKIDLRLTSTTWLLLGVFFAVTALGPHIHLAAMHNLFGIESETKNK